MRKICTEYEDGLLKIMQHGTDRGDRTGTGTRSLFGLQMRWNLNEGFPLVTTKQVFTRPMVEELLWMISGSTDNNELLAKNVSIWSEWAATEQCAEQGRADGDLGPMYGSAWREWTANYVTTVEPRVKEKESLVSYPLWPIEMPEQPVRKNGAAGRRCINADGLTFTVLREYLPPECSRNVYDIQFDGTGYVKKGVSFPALRTGAIVKDPYHPSILGVACVGDGVGGSEFERGIYQTWFAMIRRCYDAKHPAYANYGEAGVFVCNRWLVYSQFRQDIVRVRGWRQRRLNPTGIELDKDFYSSNCYSVDTCSWLSQAENTAYTGQALEAITAGGERRRYLSIGEAARELGMSTPSVRKGLDTGSAVKGCYFNILNGSYRRVTYIDQLQWAIEELRKNPDSRRVCITAWNPANSHRVALEACHAFFQFWVADGTLSCQLYQRSADMFLGVPFNIASYALLTHMVAQQCGLKVGEFIWTGGDCHIYKNHFDQVNLQLTRRPKPFPTLHLAPAESIFDYQLENVQFIGYEHYPAIRGEVSV